VEESLFIICFNLFIISTTEGRRSG